MKGSDDHGLRSGSILLLSRESSCWLSSYSCLTCLSLPISKISRNGSQFRGKLAQLLSEGASPNPRWLVQFDGQPPKEEEVFEHSFSRVIDPYDETFDDLSDAKAVSKGASRRGPASRSSGASSEGEVTDDKEKEDGETTEDKSGQLSPAEGSNAGSDDSSSSRKSSSDRVSAREARSRRRQAKVDVPAEGTQGATRSGKKRPPPPTNNKRQRDDGKVVKVKLLTGTLYLHRGPQRRVEFVRRV